MVTLEERIDPTSAAGELIFHVFAAIAHFERRLISERIKDGRQAARMRGKKPGRPPLDPETVLAAGFDLLEKSRMGENGACRLSSVI